jgi:hypothetical protein
MRLVVIENEYAFVAAFFHEGINTIH